MLERLDVPEDERTRRIALQAQRERGDGDRQRLGRRSPQDVRRDADTPWFKSWLLFDPAITLEEVKQPVLVVQGALDTEASPADADRLEELARNKERRSAEQHEKVIVAGVNHAFVPATTGGYRHERDAARPCPPRSAEPSLSGSRSVAPAR